MLRSHTCGELNLSHLDKEVTLSGWVQKSRASGVAGHIMYGISMSLKLKIYYLKTTC